MRVLCALVLLTQVLPLAACGEDPSRYPAVDAASGDALPLDLLRLDGAGPAVDQGHPPSNDGSPLPTDASTAPGVAFVSPANGASVSNPVLFKVAAKNVDQVEIFADQTYSLGPAWDPKQKSTLLYRFSGTGSSRKLHVTGSVAGKVVATAPLTITIKPDPCEDLFFVKKFDANNTDPTGKLDLVTIREGALTAIKQQVSDLKACGAQVSLGGLLSLLYYEGLFRVGAFNTRCEENSYYKSTSGCDKVPEALYSYQLGLGTIHTSNFHPCKGGSYTQKMRQRFLTEAAAAGFPTQAGLVTPTIKQRLLQVCPGATPSAVDYYLLGVHDIFNVPKDSAGNYLPGHGIFPLFTPKVSVGLAFAEMKSSCSSITSDRKAITIYGGGDASYASTAKQDQILNLYQLFKSASCP